jgi:predicted enzyme related to lactoylglutathione lyase
MPAPQFNLIVLRVADIDRSSQFYTQLGISFEKHRHGTGPVHCVAVMSEIVFELYPASKTHPVTSSVRIGFKIQDIAHTITQLGAFDGWQVVSPVSNSEWGLRAVITDLDGHRIELTQGG